MSISVTNRPGWISFLFKEKNLTRWMDGWMRADGVFECCKSKVEMSWIGKFSQYNARNCSVVYFTLHKITKSIKSTKTTHKVPNYPHWNQKYQNSRSFRFSAMKFVFSKSAWGEQAVEDIHIFTCEWVSGFVCTGPPGQTKYDTGMKFGTHTPLDHT